MTNSATAPVRSTAARISTAFVSSVIACAVAVGGYTAFSSAGDQAHVAALTATTGTTWDSTTGTTWDSTDGTTWDSTDGTTWDSTATTAGTTWD
ncbi:hypothetical protein ACQPYK_02385 [Streptosporangium sp. CA-135522]|uniref:hypothetical protein n=1 Tax=Streptosporangium sp. CA-135522 TaxID=3240072 RepID=UPI003D8D1698